MLEFYIFSDALGASSPESLYSPSTELLAFVFGGRPANFWNARLGGHFSIVEIFSNFVFVAMGTPYAHRIIFLKKMSLKLHLSIRIEQDS